MKKATLILLLLMLMGACERSQPGAPPSVRTVDAIERKLAAHPCIGNLDQWERNYRFARPNGLSAYTARADVDVIEFHLRRAGTITISPGRNILQRVGVDDWPDGKGTRYIDGRYRIHDQRLSISGCRSDGRQGKAVTSR